MRKENKIKVSVFCGGRGSASIIKHFMGYSNIELTLLVNAYDDGKSTGELRRLIPGFLGPSDFRKNFSYLIDFYSPEQQGLYDLLEYRFKKNFSKISFLNFSLDCRSSDKRSFFFEISNLITSIHTEKQEIILRSIKIIANFISKNEKSFNFEDCSFGNLVFGGFFLLNNNNFNACIGQYANLINSEVKICNVSVGVNRKLVALKENGYFVRSESGIVNNQNRKKIRQIFLVEEFFLNTLKNIQKKHLIANQSIPSISLEAKKAIVNSDILIYGPGTQHSSLYPSYMICHKAIKVSKAKKYFILNLDYDNDIYNFKTKDIVKKALFYLNDVKNFYKTIDLIFVDRLCKFNNLKLSFQNAKIILKDFRSNHSKEIHSGQKIYDSIFLKKSNIEKPSLLLFMDLINVSASNNLLLDDLLEIDWIAYFKKVTIVIHSNTFKIKNSKSLPKNINIKIVKSNTTFFELEIFKKWRNDKKFDYLFSLSGDGIFKMKDLIQNYRVLKDSECAFLVGSRSQDSYQHLDSIKNVYGNNFLLILLSRLSKKIMTLVFYIIVGKFFTDPHTGFRLYSKSKLSNIKNYKFKKMYSPTHLAKIIVQNQAHVIEVPISYSIKKKFTNKKYRMIRYVKNLLGVFC